VNFPIPGTSPLILDSPWWLILSVAAPLVGWWLLRIAAHDRTRRLAAYADDRVRWRVMEVARIPSRIWMLLAALVLAGLAMGGVRWGVAPASGAVEGIDLVIAIDASLSMAATDERPSRLERVKQEVRRLRAMNRGDRVALIAFAGRSYLLTPLTTDDGAIDLLLDTLDPSTVGQAGSAIGKAIEQGTTLLLASDGLADRALVLFSDGESFDDPDAVRSAAQQAGARGITLVTVGVGSVAGTTIPVREPNGRQSPKRDAAGTVVTTRYVPTHLAAAATAARGAFIPAEVVDKATRIRSALRQLRTARREADERQTQRLRLAWILWPALLLLALDTWQRVGGRADRSTRHRSAMASFTSLLLVAVLPLAGLGSCRQPPDPAVLLAEGQRVEAVQAFRDAVASGDSSVQARYNLGTALLAIDSLDAAQGLLEPVRRLADDEVQARARFNAGLTALRLARLMERGAASTPGAPARGEASLGEARLGDAEQQRAVARDAFRAFLRERPGHREAQWNYELSLRRPSTAPKAPGGGAQPTSVAPATGTLDPKQADALLASASREERDVHRRRRRPSVVPPGGKDW